MEPVNLRKSDAEFIRQIESESGQKVNKCYQCGNCTAGCPMSFAYDYSVNKIMRLIQLVQKDAALSSEAIWMCATCEACTTHCPNNIEVARVLDICRGISRRLGYKGVKNVRLFTDSFLQSVRRYGRSHELGMMTAYKLRSLRYLDDIDLAPGMLLRNKLPILPHRIKKTSEVADIFKRFDAGDHLKVEGGRQ
jgi:heterodisulfide reductase subunit C